MRAPLFWWRPAGLLAFTLSPLALIWRSATRRRIAKGQPTRAGVPVVCVGNLTVGGTGKTPTVIALLSYFAEKGIAAHVVSRGYGGSMQGPVRVDERAHVADQVGDEPLLISAFGPCWVAKDRVAGAKAAVAGGAQVILLDDGFQNPGLHKDISIVVVDAETGFGNGRVIPAGPLREPLRDGIQRTDAFLLVGPEAARKKVVRDWPDLAKRPCIGAEIKPLQTGMDWRGTRFLAFAGIGRPGKFFATLEKLGADVVGRHAFGDHMRYEKPILQRLEAEAKARKAQLVTTEKDAARLPPSFRSKVLALPVRLEIADRDTLDTILAPALSGSDAD